MDIRRYELIKATGELPSPRGVALEIITLTQSENVSSRTLARVIKADPAFAGRLIKAANGARAERARPVVAVEDALLVLGLNAVRGLALGFSLLEHYREGRCEAFDYEGFWAHSLFMALALQERVREDRVLDLDEAFSLGLVARIGELALATLYPEGFSRALRASGDERGELRFSKEQAELGINHAELGAAMLHDWGLPSLLAKAIAAYERPQLSEAGPESRARALEADLRLASLLASACLASADKRQARTRELVLAADAQPLQREQLLGWCKRALARWPSWAKLLGLEVLGVDGLEELVLDDDAAGEEGAATGEAGQAAVSEAQAAPASAAAAPPASSAPQWRALLACLPHTESVELAFWLSELGWKARRQEEVARVAQDMLDFAPQLVVINMLTAAGSPDPVRLALMRDLRRMRHGSKAYVLAVLAPDDEAQLSHVLENGVDDLLPLPLSRSVLRLRLRTAERLARLHGDLHQEQKELREVASRLIISNRRLKEAAMTDVLTGLPNRRYAIERMEAEWAAAASGQQALAVMLIDLDNFKRINDRHGHDAGDRSLRQIAQTLSASLRERDVICRTGGDEFLVICPDTGLKEAMRCAERMRQVAGAMPSALQPPLSISIGVAAWVPGLGNIDALLKLADQGAYLAKSRGRNAVVAVQQLRPD